MKNPKAFVPEELKEHVDGLKKQTEFKSTRKIIEFKGHKLEIYCATFKKSELFEIECETEEEQKYKTDIQELLKGIKWEYSTTTKHKRALEDDK